MHSFIAASITELKQDLKQDMTTQLESVISMIYTKLHIPVDHPLSDPPLHTEVESPLIPIIFIPITFSVTYAFHGWM
jgi:hypothetical protein